MGCLFRHTVANIVENDVTVNLSEKQKKDGSSIVIEGTIKLEPMKCKMVKIPNGIMSIPPTEQGAGRILTMQFPDWIKNNAGWWADGQIDDGSFVSGLQWLISNGSYHQQSREQDLTMQFLAGLKTMQDGGLTDR